MIGIYRSGGRMLMAMCGIAVLSASLQAAEVQLLSCDTAWTDVYGGASSSTASGQEGAGAIQINFPALTDGSALPYVYRDLPVDKKSPGLDWSAYDGIRMWVKGDGSCDYGVIDLRDGNWWRYYAVFPLSNGVWTEVTIPWREFVQRSWEGTLDANLNTIEMVAFSGVVPQLPGHPMIDIPARSFDVDDIRLVNGLTLLPTPTVSSPATSIDVTVTKMMNQEPVNIVVLGSSIDWGLKTTDPANDNWARVLEGQLRSHYGYSGITVTCRAFKGANSYEIATIIGETVFSPAPDLVIFGASNYNDCEDFIDDSGLTLAEKNAKFDDVADNDRRLYGTVLRHGGIEIMQVLSGIRVKSGDLDDMDPIYDRVKAICAVGDMNIYTADVYAEFKSLGDVYLLSNYYTSVGDAAHPNTDGHIAVAQIVYDAIIAVSPVTGGGAFQFDQAAYSVMESAGATVTLHVQRIGGSSGAASVDWATADGTATAGTDYTAAGGTLSWIDGNADTQDIVINISNDSVLNPDRSFTVSLSNTSGASLGSPNSVTVTITDDDQPGTIQFNAATYSVTEATGATVTLTITRTGGTAGATQVQVAQTGGTATSGVDYTGLPATVTFPDGSTADQTVTLTLVNDTDEEGVETAELTLSIVSGTAALGSQSTATVTIVDDDLQAKSRSTTSCFLSAERTMPVGGRVFALACLAWVGIVVSAFREKN